MKHLSPLESWLLVAGVCWVAGVLGFSLAAWLSNDRRK